VTRRALLTVLLAMLGLGIVRWVRDVRERGARSEPVSLAQQLRDHFDYLVLDAAVLEAFVGDYLADTARVRRGERIEAVGSRFLLSTDFFQHGGDESRALRYVAYFDPYRSPCYNPLAEFDA